MVGCCCGRRMRCKMRRDAVLCWRDDGWRVRWTDHVSQEFRDRAVPIPMHSEKVCRWLGRLICSNQCRTSKSRIFTAVVVQQCSRLPPCVQRPMKKKVRLSEILHLISAVMIDPSNTAVPTAIPDQAEMHIDEESRPRFPPSSQTVCTPCLPSLTSDLYQIPNQKSNHPTSSSDSPSQQLDKNLPSPRRASPAAGTHERQNKASRNADKQVHPRRRQFSTKRRGLSTGIHTWI